MELLFTQNANLYFLCTASELQTIKDKYANHQNIKNGKDNLLQVHTNFDIYATPPCIVLDGIKQCGGVRFHAIGIAIGYATTKDRYWRFYFTRENIIEHESQL